MTSTAVAAVNTGITTAAAAVKKKLSKLVKLYCPRTNKLAVGPLGLV